MARLEHAKAQTKYKFVLLVSSANYENMTIYLFWLSIKTALQPNQGCRNLNIVPKYILMVITVNSNIRGLYYTASLT